MPDATFVRPDWDEYFLGIAKAVAARADCRRRQVGAVIVDVEKRIASTGYNGTYPGNPGCLSGNCPRAFSTVVSGSNYDSGAGICHAVHGEMNAILFSDRERLRGATLYITDEPCYSCRKHIRSTPIRWVVWPEGRYDNE